MIWFGILIGFVLGMVIFLVGYNLGKRAGIIEERIRADRIFQNFLRATEE